MRRALIFCGLAVLLGAPSAAAGAGAPAVGQMVVFRSGAAVTKQVKAKEVSVKVDRRRCTAGGGTALAALVRSRVGKLGLRDFGSCSKRPRDGAGLFVKSIRGERNRGQDGWVYKVGNRGATAGAADPAGAFGRGRLRAGQRVTWFFCRLRDGGCQRTLGLKASLDGAELLVTVRGYDDEGRGEPVEGATVTAGALSVLTAADGSARLPAEAAASRLVATKDGLVRSFAERVAVP